MNLWPEPKQAPTHLGNIEYHDVGLRAGDQLAPLGNPLGMTDDPDPGASREQHMQALPEHVRVVDDDGSQGFSARVAVVGHRSRNG